MVTPLEVTHLGGESRKVNSKNQRCLIMMELAEAPVMSLNDWTNQSRNVGGWVVNLGGVVRLVLVLLSAPASLTNAKRRSWFANQLRLSLWLSVWRPGTANALV